MNTRALSIGSASALVVAGLFVSLPASAAETTCQGQVVTIAATADGQRLEGTEGPDVISAVGYDDVEIDADGGDDLVCAGRRSVVEGGPGADTFVDQRNSILSYPEATIGVQIDLAAGTVVDGGETDTVIGFHRARGTAYHDTFVGTSGDDSYTSYTEYTGDPNARDGDIVATGAGDDDVSAFRGEIDLGPGDDRGKVVRGAVQGGPGDDQVSVVMTGTARGGPGDDLVSGWVDAEELGQEEADDRLEMEGGPGRDRLTQPGVSAQAGNRCPEFCAHADVVGGSGRDTLVLASYSGVVDLATGRARTKNGRSELSSIENVVGSRRDDVIRGDAGRNHLDGGRGDDVLVGRGGDDLLHGYNGDDQARGGAGRDRCGAEVRRSC